MKKIIGKMSLTWRLVAAAGGALLMGVVASGLLVSELQSVSDTYNRLLAQDEVQHQDRARVMQVEFKKQVQEWKDLLLRGYQYENFQKYQTNFQNEEATVQKEAQELERDVKDPAAHAMIGDFIAVHNKMSASYGAAMNVFGASKGLDVIGADAKVKGQDRPPTDSIDKIVERLRQVVADRRDAEQASVAHSIKTLVISIAVAFFAIVGLVIVLLQATRREMVALTTQLTDANNETAAAAEQVSTSAQALAQGATEQAASLEETSASMEEMASMTRKNAENSRTVAALMADVNTRVNGSLTALSEMVTSMAEIEGSSHQVAKIIRTIEEIAFQTNILALNAAVEAARAGDAGMGFAVVADEVRNLAQRSAQAAKDTADLIEGSLQKTRVGTEKVGQVSASITAITDGVGKVKNLVDEVSAASQQQAQGIDHVSHAVAQMEKVTQTTAATAEESAAASEELTAQAEAGSIVVNRLEALVGGSRTRPVVQRPPVSPTRAKTARLLKLPAKSQPPAQVTAEDVLPLGDTGTFGKF